MTAPDPDSDASFDETPADSERNAPPGDATSTDDPLQKARAEAEAMKD